MEYKIKYLNFWKNDGNVQDRWFNKFLENNFNIKIKEITAGKPDIIVSSCVGKIYKIKKYQNVKLKIFFYGENLEREEYKRHNNFAFLKKYYDLIIGFKYTDKQNKIFRLPLWMIYYPFYNLNDSNNNIINYIENQFKLNFDNNKKDCTLVASHDKNKIRTKIFNQVSKYCNVHCPGIFKKNCDSIGYKVSDKINFIKKYKYNICPENSKFEGYFTEKIFHAFESGCIPIYWAVDFPEKDILNENCCCFIDFNNIPEKIKDLFSKNKQINKIFKENAKDILKVYYDDIINEIKKYL